MTRPLTGDANLWLQNGATWNNEVVDTIIKNPWGGEKWAGSRVTNFTGGESEAKAGNIFQSCQRTLYQPACHQQGHQQIRGQSGAFSVYPQLPGSSADF